jgi:hypothetical protein
MSIFKVPFDILDYRDIIPDVEEYSRHDIMINLDEFNKGNIHNCVWKRYYPTPAEINSPKWRQREVRRILRTGVWICIKEEIVWIPPNYYFALQYGKTGEEDLQFRLKRLKHVYFKIRARKDARVMGTYTIKNRQDGESTMAITDAFWECLDGNMFSGQIGIQSKTRADAFNPCWRIMQMLWQNLPKWLKDDLCSDFASGDKIAEKMQFMREATDTKKGRNILLEYFPSVYNAMDGRNNMKKCILDEVNKWKECSFYDAFTNYKKFIMPAFERRGLFDIFSSPADINGKWNDESFEFWKGSNPLEITETGTTSTRILRYYSNPLEGVQGAYDEYGDADANQIYDHIQRERKNAHKDKLMGEVRGFPLNEEEMFGSFELNSTWDNHLGLVKRKIFLTGRRYKDEKTKEPVAVYGNLEWRGGVLDTEVDFRMSDKDHFDMRDARFAFSYLPQNKEELQNVFKPPLYVESCLGVDPYNLRYEAKNKGKQSLGAMVNHKFRDLAGTGINKCPTMVYHSRPSHQDLFFEDAIKAAVFNRALVQYENRSDKLANYFEDRGYFDWLLPEMGAAINSNRKGDAPSGSGKFLEEGMGLISAITNTPLNEDEPYLLERNWMLPLIEDLLTFNSLDTHRNDLTMSWIQALVGSSKIMYKKIRSPSDVTHAVLSYLLT